LNYFVGMEISDREPRLTDDGLKKIVDKWVAGAFIPDPPYPSTIVRDFYEDLIAKGKLIVAGVDRIVVTTGDNGIRCRSVLMGGPIQAWVAIPEDEYERLISEGAIVLKKEG
jgi:hypothetical protein